MEEDSLLHPRGPASFALSRTSRSISGTVFRRESESAKFDDWMRKQARREGRGRLPRRVAAEEDPQLDRGESDPVPPHRKPAAVQTGRNDAWLDRYREGR